MSTKLIFAGLLVMAFGCGSGPKNGNINRTDTVVVAYQQAGNWRFNSAQIWSHMGRVWVGDSGLDGKMDVIREIRLQLAPVKADSIMDSVKHSLVMIIPRYDAPLLDSLNKYIHVLDTLHYPAVPSAKKPKPDPNAPVQSIPKPKADPPNH